MNTEKENSKIVETILNKAGIKTKEQEKTEVVAGCMSIICTFFLQALILYLLWNALVPDIFGLTALTFWQACGMKFLVGSLLPGLGRSKSKKE